MFADPVTVLERLHTAINRHDLDTFVDCFAADYASEQPAHPDRAFHGRAQVRANWSAFFAGVPDLRADLLSWVSAGSVVWAEWRWSGTRLDHSLLDMRGVTIMGTEDGRIAWGRLYMEETETDGEGIAATVQHLAGATAR